MTLDTPPAQRTAEQWLLLPLKWLLRLAVYAVFIIYIFVGTGATIELYKRTVYQSQDISALYTVIDKSVQENKPKILEEWLKARPLAETDKLVSMIEPKSAPLGYGVFFEIFQRELQLDRPEEALFWLQLSRFRLRYDVVRCGTDAKGVHVFDRVMNTMQSPETNDLLRQQPELLKKAVQRVLDFDAKYPAHNDPGPICKTITEELPVEEINWDGYRQMLRKKTEEFTQPLGEEVLPEIQFPDDMKKK